MTIVKPIRVTLVHFGMVVSLALAGCVSEPAPKEPMIKVPAPAKTPPAGAKPANASDAASQASADAMHELCGAFLLYFSVHNVMPETLEQLRDDQGLDGAAIVSPTTGTTFLYERAGMLLPRINQRLYVVEAESRQGVRWGIAIDPPAAGKPLVTRVVAVTDDDLKVVTR